jgi:triacylglycerol lipase
VNVILAHGVLGFRKRFRVEYFNRVAEYLGQLGGRVLVTEVNPTGGIAIRGEALRSQIIAAFSDGTLDPAEKAHIIGHSMGGLDSRYLLSPANASTTPQNDLSSRIASLTTISSPHRGSPIADLFAFEPAGGGATLVHLRGIVDGLSALERAATELLNHFGISLDALQELTTESCQAFNLRYPDHPAVRYFAVAGSGRPGPLPTALVLSPFYKYILARTGQPNDGLVSVSSAQWGAFDPNTWPCDHAEEIGHDLDRPLKPARFDYLARYEEILRRASNANVSAAEEKPIG